jgi:hypothetical protein
MHLRMRCFHTYIFPLKTGPSCSSSSCPLCHTHIHIYIWVLHACSYLSHFETELRGNLWSTMWRLERKLRRTVLVGRAGVLVAKVRYSWVLHSAMTITERCMIRKPRCIPFDSAPPDCGVDCSRSRSGFCDSAVESGLTPFVQMRPHLFLHPMNRSLIRS